MDIISIEERALCNFQPPFNIFLSIEFFLCTSVQWFTIIAFRMKCNMLSHSIFFSVERMRFAFVDKLSLKFIFYNDWLKSFKVKKKLIFYPISPEWWIQIICPNSILETN